MAQQRSSGLNMAAKLLTELVGTFIFFSAISLSFGAGNLAPLAIGSVLMVMVFMGGHISGAHYNPAVSFGVFLRGKIGLGTLIAYWITQIIASILAFSFGYVVSGHASAIAPGSGITTGQALGAEIVFTVALVLVVLNVAVTRQTQGNSFYGLAIGFTVMVGAFVVGPISGGAFNPAVGFGATFSAVAFGTGGWSHLWIYVVGPLIGSVIAAAIHMVQVAGLEAAAEPPEGHPSPGAPAPVPE